MGFRFVPKSVTLNDLERHNDRYLAFFAEFGRFTADYVKVVEDSLYSLRRKCSPNNLVFSDISLMAIYAEITENERIIDRHLRGIHPLPDYDACESQSMISI